MVTAMVVAQRTVSDSSTTACSAFFAILCGGISASSLQVIKYEEVHLSPQKPVFCEQGLVGHDAELKAS